MKTDMTTDNFRQYLRKFLQSSFSKARHEDVITEPVALQTRRAEVRQKHRPKTRPDRNPFHYCDSNFDPARESYTSYSRPRISARPGARSSPHLAQGWRCCRHPQVEDGVGGGKNVISFLGPWGEFVVFAWIARILAPSTLRSEPTQ